MDKLRSRLDNLDAILRADSMLQSDSAFFDTNNENASRRDANGTSSCGGDGGKTSSSSSAPHVLLQDITGKINTTNAFQVLQRCDELEAMLNTISTNSYESQSGNRSTGDAAPSSKPHHDCHHHHMAEECHGIAGMGRTVNDAYQNFVFAKKAQDDAMRHYATGSTCGWNSNYYPVNNTRRKSPELNAYETMFPAPSARPRTKRKPRQSSSSSSSNGARYGAHGSSTSASSLYGSYSRFNLHQRRGESRKRDHYHQHYNSHDPNHIADEVRSASYAAESAVRAAAEAVRQGPGISKAAAIASKKEKVALVREIAALRKHATVTSRQSQILQQRATVREEEIQELKKLVKVRDQLILEAEVRVKDLQKLHIEEIEIERKKANEAIATRDNLALVYRTSLMRLLNDRCDQCRKTMSPDNVI